MEKIVVEGEKKERIDSYLANHTDYSRSLIKKMLEQRCITCNGIYGKASMKVSQGDIIEFVDDFIKEDYLEKENIMLDVVYESSNVLLINKPSGMVVHPGNGHQTGTLVHALKFYTESLSDFNGAERPGIVHRIDKDTSGLLLVAKNNKAHEILGEQFKNHEIKRKYLALVKGNIQHNHITIDAPIGRDELHRKKMTVTDKNSKKAITHVNVLKRYGDYTLVECILETGRTHQIRVHMNYIGFPIFNDPLYGKEVIPSFGQFLHSYEIFFTEPLTKEELHFKVEPPKEFSDFLSTLE